MARRSPCQSLGRTAQTHQADQDHAGGGEAFAGDAAVPVLFEAGIEHRIGNLIADLVGMSFGHGFGRKGTKRFCHRVPSLA